MRKRQAEAAELYEKQWDNGGYRTRLENLGRWVGRDYSLRPGPHTPPA